jgi:hypothetical protein
MAGESTDGGADGPAEAAWDVTWRIWRRPLIAAAVLLALSNVIFGLLFRRDWLKAHDFELVTSWARAWLHGTDLYSLPDARVDYAPAGLVLLSPVAALSSASAMAVWTLLHLALTIAAATLAVRLGRFERERALMLALVVALPPFRVPLQFSLLCFVLALGGFLSARRSPGWAGVAIGLSLFKPQIGGPALIWAVAARQWRTVAAAAATAAALTAIYAARVARSPVAVLLDWWPSLARKQNQIKLGFGETNLQPWLAPLGFPPVTTQLLTAAALSAALVWIAARRREASDLRLFAAACLVSLLAIRHLSYDLLLAIPAVVFALTRGDLRARMAGGIALAIFILSPPSLWRALAEPRGFAPALEPIAMHAYRAAAAALLACTLFSGGRERLQSTSRASL